MAKSTGLKAIAYELGVSVNTVSRALRDCKDISEHTKEIIRKKAYELGYIQSTVANFLKKDEMKCIAIIINNLDNMYFSISCNILSHKIRERGLEVDIIVTLKKSVDEDVVKQCISQRADGIISLVHFNSKAMDIAKLNALPVCFMGIDCDDPYCDVINNDYENGVAFACNYLINYHKFSKLVFVDHPNALNTNDKYNLFVNTISKISTKAKVVRISPSDLKNSVLDLFNKGFFGFFCYNDEIAYNCLDVLNKLFPNFRKNYPRFHIVGVDALSTMANGLVDISSVDLNLETQCDRAIEYMLQRLEGVKRERVKEIVPVKFHQRVLF